MDNQQERLASYDFIGGLIVGEGCFSLNVIHNKGGSLISPCFYLFMTDRDTVELMYYTLKSNLLPGYFETRRAKGNSREQYGIRVNGVKNINRFCETINPHLFGEKLQAAETVHEFCIRRLDLGRGAGYWPDDIDFIKKMRKINGQRSHHKYPLDQLPSILRDYTPCPSA